VENLAMDDLSHCYELLDERGGKMGEIPKGYDWSGKAALLNNTTLQVFVPDPR